MRRLRDTGITWMLRTGKLPAEVMRWAGHDDIATTMG
jgi:integrase